MFRVRPTSKTSSAVRGRSRFQIRVRIKVLSDVFLRGVIGISPGSGLEQINVIISARLRTKTYSVRLDEAKFYRDHNILGCSQG